MSDLVNFTSMLDKANVEYNKYEGPDEWNEDGTLDSWVFAEEFDSRIATIVIVMPGYRCHYEAAFDAEGNLVETGQFGDM